MDTVQLQDEQYIKQIHDYSSFNSYLGFQFIEAKDGKATITMDIDSSKHWNTNDVVHGGVYGTMLDTVSGLAIRSKLSMEQTVSTVNLSINYTKSTIKGKLTAKGTVVSLGRRIATVEAKVFNEDGELLSYSMGTFVVQTRRK